MAGRVEDRLREAGVVLPAAAKPVATYVPAVVANGLVYVSGQLPMRDGALGWTGKVGETVAIEDAVEAARLCFLNVLAQLSAACEGDLDIVTRVVRLGGFVACTPSFTQHAQVMNGASDLAVQIFDDAGRHARATVGVASLPLDAPVEIEGLFAID